MALTPGTRLGPYVVTARIGVGGMGEVYRATDTNLKRSVAIKVLPSGTSRVVVQPFPDPAKRKWQVSARGGVASRWGRDGKELYFMDLTGLIVSVAITTDPVFEVGKATSVSAMLPDGQARLRTDQVMATAVIDQWDVTGDGQRVLRTAPELGASTRATSAGGGSPITVVSTGGLESRSADARPGLAAPRWWR